MLAGWKQLKRVQTKLLLLLENTYMNQQHLVNIRLHSCFRARG